MAGEPETILRVNDLKVHFSTPEGVARAVDGVNLEIGKGETLGIVGESGCGKTVTALSIMRLIPSPTGRIVNGRIWFEGRDLTSLDKKEMRKIRGNRISMIFQDPLTSLNPVYTIGTQLVETIRLHQGLSKKAAFAKAINMLGVVGIASPNRRIREYPHQMSGGMRQRVMIAMALSCNPDLLIADEPTTALDVTIQAQILELMNELKERLGTAVILITHDLGVIAEVAKNVIVMYAGRVVEQADVGTLFERPLHPYTRGLLGSIPTAEIIREKGKLYEIKGMVPSLLATFPGCLFHPRCEAKIDVCEKEIPGFFEAERDHKVACWLHKS